MTRHHDALLHLKLNRIIEGLPVDRMRGQLHRKFVWEMIKDEACIAPHFGATQVFGGFATGFAPGTNGTQHALALTFDAQGHGSIKLQRYKLGERDSALVFLSAMNYLEDVGALQYGLFDKCRRGLIESVGDFDAVTRAAMIDLRDINASLIL